MDAGLCTVVSADSIPQKAYRCKTSAAMGTPRQSLCRPLELLTPVSQ